MSRTWFKRSSSSLHSELPSKLFRSNFCLPSTINIKSGLPLCESMGPLTLLNTTKGSRRHHHLKNLYPAKLPLSNLKYFYSTHNIFFPTNYTIFYWVMSSAKYNRGYELNKEQLSNKLY